MIYDQIWEKVLAPGEKVIYEFSVGLRYRLFNFLICLLAGLILIFFSAIPQSGSALDSSGFSLFLEETNNTGQLMLFITGAALIGFGAFFFLFYLAVANAYAFTNKRVLMHRGWLSTDTISIDYSTITDIRIIEPFFNRILTGSGHLFIDTAGTTWQEIKLIHIASPYETKKKLDEIRSSFQKV